MMVTFLALQETELERFGSIADDGIARKIAETGGFIAQLLQQWERGITVSSGPACVLLTAIDNEPDTFATA